MFEAGNFWRGVRLTVGVAVLVAAAQDAAAHALPPLSLEQLVERSDATLLGHTVSFRSFWQGPRIVTVTRVAVDELWAGSLKGASDIDVVTLGGTVGELGQRVDGAGEVPAYGRVVLHVGRAASGEYAPFAMAEGIWQVDSLWGDAGPVHREVPVKAVRAGRALPGPGWAKGRTGTLGELRAAVLHVAQDLRGRRP